MSVVYIQKGYNVIEEFNMDWKAECGQINLAHVTRNKKNIWRRN